MPKNVDVNVDVICTHSFWLQKTGYNLSRASSRVMFSNLTIVCIIAWVSRRQGVEFNNSLVSHPDYMDMGLSLAQIWARDYL